MEHTSLDHYLEPPPRLVPPNEALPHLGGLTLAAHQGVLPDETEHHSVNVLKDTFDEVRAQEMMKHALEMPKVRERLERGRVMPIGISRRDEGNKGDQRTYTYLLVAYDYTANMAVEISLDEQGKLRGIRDEHYQPPLVESEIDRAIELARNHELLSTNIDGLVAMAISYSGLDNEWTNQRVIEVLFGRRADRLPKYRAWVDLGTECVLHASEISECDNKREGVKS